MKRFAALLLASCVSNPDLFPPEDAGADVVHHDDSSLEVEKFIGDVGGDEPLTFWWYAGDPAWLQPIIECALPRIRAATCLPLDVSFDAAHWIRQDTPANMGQYGGLTSGTWTSARIKLRNTLSEDARCPVLIHEIFHVLRRSDGHSTEDGSLSYTVTHIVAEPVSHITQGDLDLICARWPCGCQVPE